jgi:hypothetical protein
MTRFKRFAIDRQMTGTQPRLMKPKEIHDLLLSFLVRGLGFWLLYQAFTSGYYVSVGNDEIRMTLSPDQTPNPSRPDWWMLFFFLWQLIPAIYFIFGAPPFLKWATRKRD